MAYGIGCLDFTNLTAPKRATGLVRRQAPKGAVRRRAQDRAIIPVAVTHNNGMTWKLVNVREGSPAQSGGLREGDVVTRVGERRVRSSDELVVAVRRAGADVDVPVEVIRGGSRVELTVRPTLG